MTYEWLLDAYPIKNKDKLGWIILIEDNNLGIDKLGDTLYYSGFKYLKHQAYTKEYDTYYHKFVVQAINGYPEFVDKYYDGTITIDVTSDVGLFRKLVGLELVEADTNSSKEYRRKLFCILIEGDME